MVQITIISRHNGPAVKNLLGFFSFGKGGGAFGRKVDLNMLF